MQIPTHPLRVLVVDNPPDANGSCKPFPQFSRTQDCMYPGWCLEILHNLLEFGNMKAEWTVLNVETAMLDWGTLLPNNSFTGILGSINTGKYDVACLMYQQSEMRRRFFDFSYPVTEVSPIFVVREVPTTLYTLLFTCMRPFDTAIWVCVLATIILQVGWSVLDEIFNTRSHNFKLWGGRIARVILVVMQAALLVSLYTSIVLTSLITPTDNNPIKTITDAILLIKSGKYRLISDPSQWFNQEVQYSNGEIFKSLNDAVKNNPMLKPSTISDALEKVSSGNYIYQIQEDHTAVSDAYRVCFTMLVSGGMPYRTAHFLWGRNNSWRPVIDKLIVYNYPMIDEIYSYYFRERDWHDYRPKCPKEQFKAGGAPDPLNFWSFFGVFAVGSGGLAFAALVCLAEMVFWAMGHVKQKIRNRPAGVRLII